MRLEWKVRLASGKPCARPVQGLCRACAEPVQGLCRAWPTHAPRSVRKDGRRFEVHTIMSGIIYPGRGPRDQRKWSQSHWALLLESSAPALDQTRLASHTWQLGWIFFSLLLPAGKKKSGQFLGHLTSDFSSCSSDRRWQSCHTLSLQPNKTASSEAIFRLLFDCSLPLLAFIPQAFFCQVARKSLGCSRKRLSL